MAPQTPPSYVGQGSTGVNRSEMRTEPTTSVRMEGRPTINPNATETIGFGPHQFQSVSVFDVDQWRNQITTLILRSTDLVLQQNHTHTQICTYITHIRKDST